VVGVDVTTEIVIEGPVEDVAAFAADGSQAHRCFPACPGG
jgi:hypothetical protein